MGSRRLAGKALAWHTGTVTTTPPGATHIKELQTCKSTQALKSYSVSVCRYTYIHYVYTDCSVFGLGNLSILTGTHTEEVCAYTPTLLCVYRTVQHYKSVSWHALSKRKEVSSELPITEENNVITVSLTRTASSTGDRVPW